MTPEQERRGAELFAEGKPERQVAAELGVGAGSAHRLKLRLEAQRDGAEAGQPPPEITEPRPVGQGAPVMLVQSKPAELAKLTAQREELAGQLANLEARSEASRQAVTDLQAERLQLLDEGKDAAPLRSRAGSAFMDLQDSETAAQRCRERLADADTRIAALQGQQELAGLRAELDAAVAERDEVYARSGDRQRAAVAAVRAAAEDFCAVAAEERATVDKVAALSTAMAQRALQLGDQAPMVSPAASTRLLAQGGAGPELALTRAMHQAERGDIAAVARHLGEVNGWLPPGPPSEAERERWRQINEDRERQLAELRNRAAAGPQPIADNERVPVGVDHFGNPVDAHGNRLIPRHRMPHPLDVYGRGYANTTGGSYGPGYQLGY